MEWYALNVEQRYELIEPQDGTYHSRVLDGFYLRDEWLWQDILPDSIEVVRQLGVTV